MFQQARNLIRQLTHGGEDRRRHQRFSTDIQTICRPVHDDSEMKARVLNVSRSGVNLLVEREVPQGTMIRVDLPTEDAGSLHTTLLACIMNCRPQNDQWSLGCMFSLELTEDEIASFGGEKKKSEGSDQRAWVRSPAQGKAEYRVLPGGDNRPAEVADIVNISPGGVGLILSRGVDPGAVINISLPKRDGHGQMQMLACIVYLSEKGQQQWIAGCNFIRELSDKEIRQLI